MTKTIPTVLSTSQPDAEPGQFHPGKCLPDCMMPDGGECCPGYVALYDAYWHLMRRHAALAPPASPLRGREITDAMVNAAAREMWNDRDARHGGSWDERDPREVCVIQTRATAKAALKAALDAPPVGVEALMLATTVSTSGLDITIACNDHDTKDAIFEALSASPPEQPAAAPVTDKEAT